jgi:two-component system CheB/CheR fusion protein
MGEDVVGVILSGTGHDGALGLKTIKAMGGLTFAQGADGSAPQHAGMPASAIATGAVDIIVPVDQIPGRLLALGDPIGIQSVHEAGMTAAEVEVVRLRICDVLRDRLGHDFSLYKEKTFLRRVQRRMQTLEVASLFAYAELLERTPEETLALFRDLLIGVTTFFRDQAAFEAVRALVIPRLFEGKGASDTVRVWVAGCATGEEAYSLAILLREHMETIDTAPYPDLRDRHR